jgi:LmbE family N-acetylglucosaminyl deacetylase
MSVRNETRRVTALATLLAVCLAGTAAGQPPLAQGEGEQRLALRRLSVLASVLYVGAHPDDENTAMLAYLEKERLARAGYLSLTRGDGGQNLIGTEQGELLGLIRTEELLAARRIDGAEQLFTRAIDFGYSKSPEESLAIWGHDAVLADVVWAIRSFRPDVIITRFPANGEGGHGHHTASAILAREAFDAAADPARFPEQLAYVAPWRAKRLMWNAWHRPGETRPAVPGTLSVDLGTYNPLLGQSYTEIAAAGRSMHKSQGFGSAERRGSLPNDLEPVAGDPPVKDLFDGVDTLWTRVAGGAAVIPLLARAEASYDPLHPEAVVAALLAADDALARLAPDPWVAIKRTEIAEVIRSCTGVWLDAVAATPTAVPGGELKVTTTAIDRSGVSIALASIALPYARPLPAAAAPRPLADNRPISDEWTLALPASLPASQPYWLEQPARGGLYTVPSQTLVGLPMSPPAVTATFTLALDGHELTYRVPVTYRWTDPVEGERVRPLTVLPRVTVAVDEPLVVLASDAPKRVRVTVTANAPAADATAHLRLPAGWRSEPASAPVALAAAGDTRTLEFSLFPPVSSSEGSLVAEVTAGGATYDRGVVTIDHRHIPVLTVLRLAEARVLRVDLRHDGRNIGYVMGPGDEVPGVLRQLGYEVTLLGDDDLGGGPLDRFDAIVVGVRAYNTRPELAQSQPRLLAYVQGGGTLVLQYNVSRDLVTEQLGPYPFKLTRDRVVEENAPVELTAPGHALLTTPNRISEADFTGWVQERGLYFPDGWDTHYQTVISTHDSGEKPLAGGILYARYGRGAYVYTALAFFRQLPAGVPGAIRLFANLLAARGGA